jgi:small subunit ribosomal protein S7
MPRKYESTERFLKPDPRYGNLLVSKFVNCVMRKGKKSTALRAFYGAMDVIAQKMPGQDPVEVFSTAVQNVKPLVEVRSRRVGGANYQVPMEVKKHRQQSLAIRWILDAARAKKGRPMHERLAQELMDAFQKQGAAITTRENIHKMAEANKAFAHFAW